MASEREGRIEFDVRLNNEQIRADAAAATAAIRKIGDSTVAEGARIDSAFKQIGGTVAAAFTVQKAASFAKEIVRVRGEIEALEISLETLLGNKNKATALMTEIKSFAAATPMNMQDLAKGAQMLLGFNVEAEKVMPTLRQIGDIAMGDAAKFNSLTLAFSQMSSTGKLMGQDLLQMINAGFNPLVTMSEQTGKSIAELKKEMSDGAISADMVAAAFAAAAGEGGKFNGMLERQSEGIQGSLAKLSGAVTDMFNEMGQENQGVITGIIGGATDIVKHYKEVGEALAVIIGLYGTYKAAVMATAAIDKTAATVAANAEMAALTNLLPVKEQNAYADIMAAVAAGKLTQAKAEELIALRAEVQTRLSNLKATQAAAAQELAAAEVTLGAARSRMAALTAEVDAKKQNLAAAVASGNQAKIEAAEKRLLNIQTKANNAAQTVENASKAVGVAASKHKVAATAAETLAEKVNTASKNANTAASFRLAAVSKALTAATARLNAVILSNPYAWAAAAVIALAYGIYKLVTYQTEAEKTQAKLNEKIKEGETSMKAEGIEVDILFNRLKNAKKGTEEWNSARNAIMSKYGQYLKHLGDEKTALNDIAVAQQAVYEQVMATARARIVESAATEAANELAKKEVEVEEKIKKELQKKVKEGIIDGIEADNILIKLKPVIEGKSEITEEIKEILEPFNYTIVSRGAKRNDIATSLHELKEVSDATKKTLSGLTRQYGEFQKPQQGENAFDVMNASLKQLEDELPKAKAKLDELKGTKIGLYDSNQQEFELQKAIKAQDQLVKSIDDTIKKRQNELDTVKAIEDRIKELKEKQETTKIGSIEYQDYDKQITMLKNKLPDNRKKPKDFAEELEKQLIEETRKIEDLAHQQAVAKIEAEKEGTDKELALLQEHHNRKLVELNRQEQDLLAWYRENAKKEWEAANPNWEKDGLKFKGSEADKKATAKGKQESSEYFAKLRSEETAAYNKSVEKAYKEELRSYENYTNAYLSKAKEFEDNLKNLKKKQEEQRKAKGKDAVDIISDESIATIDKRQQEQLAQLDEAMNIKEATFVAFIEGLVSTGTTNINDLIKELNVALENAQHEMEAAGKSGDAAAVNKAKAKVAALQKRLDDILNIKDETKEVKAGDPAKKWKDTLSVMESVKTLTNDIAGNFEGLDDSTKAILNAAMNIATGVINMIIGINTLAVGSAAATTMTATTATEAIKGVERASVILAIISAALQIAQAIASVIKNIFSKDKKKEKEIQNLQRQVDALQTSYDKLGKAVDKAYSANAAKLIEEQNQNLEQQKALLEEQIRIEEGKKKTDSAKVQQYKDAIKEIDNATESSRDRTIEAMTGSSVKSAIDEFAEAYMNAWSAGEDKAKSMKDVVRKMVKSSIAELIKMRTSGEVEKFVNLLTDAMEDGILSAAEERALDAAEAKIYRKAERAAKAGFDKYVKDEDNEDEREASTKGFASMSQDSADELNGRFTALQALTHEILAGVKLLATYSATALKHLAGIETNTRNLLRLIAIEADLKTIKTGINDMNVKGLKLR
jgi:tape measure domain-containing protein